MFDPVLYASARSYCCIRQLSACVDLYIITCNDAPLQTEPIAHMGPTKSHMGESERDVPNVHCVLHCILHCNLQCALCTARPVTRSKSQDPCLMARSLVICNRSRCFYKQCNVRTMQGTRETKMQQKFHSLS